MREHRRLRVVRRLLSCLVCSLPAETWMVDRTDLLLNCRPFYWANFSLRAAGQPQPCTGARVRLGLSSFQTRNCRELPTFINPIQVRRVSVFCIWSFMNQTSRAAQAGRQPSRTPGPKSQSPRHEAARNRCHVSGRLPLALRRASACPSGYENPPGRSAQGTQQQWGEGRKGPAIKCHTPSDPLPPARSFWLPVHFAGLLGTDFALFVLQCAWQKLATLTLLEGFDCAGTAPAHVISVMSSRHLVTTPKLLTQGAAVS